MLSQALSLEASYAKIRAILLPQKKMTKKNIVKSINSLLRYNLKITYQRNKLRKLLSKKPL